jgi:hypothetical protein
MFFFEKKNQKTFAPSPSPATARLGNPRITMNKSFLVLFFKKEHLPSLSPAPLP